MFYEVNILDATSWNQYFSGLLIGLLSLHSNTQSLVDSTYRRYAQ